MDALRRAATSGAAFSFLSIVAVRAFGFLTSLVLARILEPQGFGRYSILLGFSAVAILVAGFGITIIIPKLVAETVPAAGGPGPASGPVLRSLITIAGCLGLLTGMAVILFSPLLASLMLGSESAWPMLAMVGVSVSAMSWSTATGAFLQGLHEIRRLAWLNTAGAALYLAICVPAALFFGVTGAFAAMAVSHLGLTLAGIASLPRGGRRPAWGGETRAVMARGVRLGWPLLLSAIALALVGWALRAWLGRTAGLAEVARYQVGETLNQAILFVPLALAMPLYPLASTMAGASPEEKAKVFGPAFTYVSLFTLPVFLVVGWGARLWVGLFGPEYRDAWPVVYLLTGGYFLSGLATVTMALLAGFGLTLQSMRLTVFWAILCLVPGMILAPRFGAMGVAAAQVASYTIQAIVITVYLRRRLGIRVIGAPRLLVTFALLFGLGFVVLPRVGPWTGALLVIPAAAIVFLVAGDLRRRAVAHVMTWLRPGR